jgi:hypothetical protein
MGTVTEGNEIRQQIWKEQDKLPIWYPNTLKGRASIGQDTETNAVFTHQRSLTSTFWVNPPLRSRIQYDLPPGKGLVSNTLYR